MPEVSTDARLVILALIHFIFIATFAISRQLRRSAQRSAEELEQVTRAITRRDALLAEARQDLNLALHVGGPGPYTGQRIGSYELGPILGRGAMGEIYDAVHTTNGEPCALKMLHPQVLAEPGHYRRFLREAEISASLDAENEVRDLEVGSGENADACPRSRRRRRSHRQARGRRPAGGSRACAFSPARHPSIFLRSRSPRRAPWSADQSNSSSSACGPGGRWLPIRSST